MNLEGLSGFSVALPFVESAYRNDASLPLDQFSEHRTGEHGLAFGVHRGQLRLERRLVSRNKLPVHKVQSSAAVDDAKYRRVHRRAEVVDRLRHEYDAASVGISTAPDSAARVAHVCRKSLVETFGLW